MTGVVNRIQPGDGDERHGTENGYNNHGCRCPACTDAHRIKHNAYMHADPARLERHRNRMKAARPNRKKEQRES